MKELRDDKLLAKSKNLFSNILKLKKLNIDKTSDNVDNKNEFKHSEKMIDTENLSEILEDIDDFDSLELDDENN